MLVKYFALVFALAIPFWILGAIAEFHPLPGLPLSALMAFCPIAAALILTPGTERLALLKRTFDYRRIPRRIWYAPILLTMPALMTLTDFAMRRLALPLPPLRFSPLAPLLLFVVFFVAAAGEEIGWSAYMTDRMQTRWSAAQTGVILGAIWAVWHLIPFIQGHRTPAWIAWHCLATIAVRVLIVWLYNNTGHSVFAAILFHAMTNVSYFLFPNYGSNYDARIGGPFIILAAMIVVALPAGRNLRA